MSFKSYIAVDVFLPDGFDEWEKGDQELFWQRVFSMQAEAEQAYVSALYQYISKVDFDYDIESK